MSQMRLHRVTELLQSIEALLEHDCFRGYSATSSEFFFFKLVENFLAFLSCAIREEKRAMALQISSNPVCVRSVRSFFILSESNTDNFILSHKELGVGEGFAEGLEIIGAHIVEGENVEVLELVEEGVHLVDNELFVLAHLGLHLCQRDHFILLGERHQQSILL